MKSDTVLPSRTNSGFDANLTSGLPAADESLRVVPTGTVDFVTTIEVAEKALE